MENYKAETIFGAKRNSLLRSTQRIKTDKSGYKRSAWRNNSRIYCKPTAGIGLQSRQCTSNDHHASAGTGSRQTQDLPLFLDTRAGRKIATNLQAHTPEPHYHTGGSIQGPHRVHAVL